MLVFTDQYIFALELKLNGSAKAALDQIFEKGYLRSYQVDARKKIAIGINFSSEKRAVDDFLETGHSNPTAIQMMRRDYSVQTII